VDTRTGKFSGIKLIKASFCHLFNEIEFERWRLNTGNLWDQSMEGFRLMNERLKG
jgi:hypothetical protein